MAVGPVYTLTVDLVTPFGTAPLGVHVTVAMAQPRLLYPLGVSPNEETLYPVVQTKTVNAEGVASFAILPSSQAGNYRIDIGGYTRIIAMPARNARLSELMDN